MDLKFLDTVPFISSDLFPDHYLLHVSFQCLFQCSPRGENISYSPVVSTRSQDVAKPGMCPRDLPHGSNMPLGCVIEGRIRFEGGNENRSPVFACCGIEYLDASI